MNFSKVVAAFVDHIKKSFSDNGQPSSSRLLAAVHTTIASFVAVYLAIKTHTWPDGGTMAGLGAFATAPYAVNRASNMFKKDKEVDKDDADAK